MIIAGTRCRLQACFSIPVMTAGVWFYRLRSAADLHSVLYVYLRADDPPEANLTIRQAPATPLPKICWVTAGQ